MNTLCYEISKRECNKYKTCKECEEVHRERANSSSETVDKKEGVKTECIKRRQQ